MKTIGVLITFNVEDNMYEEAKSKLNGNTLRTLGEIIDEYDTKDGDLKATVLDKLQFQTDASSNIKEVEEIKFTALPITSESINKKAEEFKKILNGNLATNIEGYKKNYKTVVGYDLGERPTISPLPFSKNILNTVEQGLVDGTLIETDETKNIDNRKEGLEIFTCDKGPAQPMIEFPETWKDKIEKFRRMTK